MLPHGNEFVKELYIILLRTYLDKVIHKYL